jgi:thiamine pyrophosphokinase
MRRGLIIGGGRLDESALAAIEARTEDCLLIGVDRGIACFLENDLEADYYLGDFDSLDPLRISQIPKDRLMQYPPEKNASDLEIALDLCLDLGLKEAEVHGATGSRWDHSFSNLLSLDRYRQLGLKVVLVNGKNQAWALEERTIVEKNLLDKYTYLSVLALSPEGIVISLKDVKYPLSEEPLAFGHTRGVSNEAIGRDAMIELISGRALCILSND